MEKKITIKYRNGYPTRKYLDVLLKEFWGTRHSPQPDFFYGSRGQGTLRWAAGAINEKIPDFISFLKSKGIEVESYQLYDSPTVGHLKLRPFIKN